MTLGLVDVIDVDEHDSEVNILFFSQYFLGRSFLPGILTTLDTSIGQGSKKKIM